MERGGAVIREENQESLHLVKGKDKRERKGKTYLFSSQKDDWKTRGILNQ